MTSRKANTVLESIEGAALIAFHLLTPFLRPSRTRWGATDDELQQELPGDDLVTHPKWQFTHAVTIHAPTSEVWKWLVQIGADRGGWYSYEGLENLVGCNLHNADQILPEFQNLKPGDAITMHPKAPGMNVSVVETGRYILVHNDGRTEGARSYVHTTWLWYLDEIDSISTRVITRGRNDYSPDLANKLWMGPLFIEPISFVMERKMLLEIRRRAERNWTARPAWVY
jgi:hypothetical protein